MMLNNQPINEIIRRRFSCRAYLEKPIEAEKRRRLVELISASQSGPLGTPVRFALVSATEQDRSALRGLGTYGFIRGATGFIAGAVGQAGKNLEDYGYLMEGIILFATSLDLGTCWLGGTFTKSSFAAKLPLDPGEIMPAVAAVGHCADKSRMADRLIRGAVGADRRLPWERLFFRERFGLPLEPEEAGAYAEPLEMVRLGPSASNRQPWRILRDGNTWHFYLQRTTRAGMRGGRFYTVVDLKRVDLGIAMCHFELAARELNLPGKWAVREPEIAKPGPLTEYICSWISP